MTGSLASGGKDAQRSGAGAGRACRGGGSVRACTADQSMLAVCWQVLLDCRHATDSPDASPCE